MEIGTEISQKIRSAIKAKLVELGAYVDEELPDYIMVMVANKKNLKQMTDDLELFLGGKTEVFTSWLHDLLRKLQSIGGDVKKPSSTTSSSEPVEKHVDKTDHHGSLDDKTSKTDEEKDVAVPVIKKESQKTKSRKSEEEPAAVVTEVLPSVSETVEEVEPELLVRADTDEFSEELQLEEEKKKAKVVSVKAQQAAVPGKPNLAATAQSRVVTDSNKNSVESVKTASEPQRTVTEAVRIVDEPVRTAVIKKPHIIPTREVVDTQPVKRPPVTSRLGNKTDSRPRAIASPIKQEPPTSRLDVSRKRRAPSSVVGNVIHNNNYDEEEEYDPTNPAVGSVASVVKVTARKSSVPRSLQANKSLLMRAVNEAEKSITVKKPTGINKPVNRSASQMVVRPIRREEPHSEEPAIKQSRLQLTSKSRQQDIYRSMKYTIDNEVETPKYVIRKEEGYQPVYVGKRTDNRVVEYIPQHVTVVKEEPESDDDDVIEIVPPEKPDTPIILEDIEDDNEEEEQYIIEKVVPVARAVKEKAIVNPKFVVTLDGVDPDDYDGDTDNDVTMSSIVQTETASTRVNPPKVKQLNINLKDSDDDDVMETEDVSVTPLVQAKATERCKFWPACVNGNACQYHHPTLPCKTFPHCKFADKCLYIHPNCKYDAKCSRPDCPYTHASRRSGSAASTVPQVLAVPRHQVVVAAPSTFSQQASNKRQCLYYPNCTNMNCSFYHPIPCRFGLSCKNKFCTYFHPSVPSKDKLKWSAQKPTADSTVETKGFMSAVS